jgi:hypothetical protein
MNWTFISRGQQQQINWPQKRAKDLGFVITLGPAQEN